MLNTAALLRSSGIQVLLTMRHTTQLYTIIDTANDICILLPMTDFEFMTPH